MALKELFRADNLPVLQNRTFSKVAEALETPVGDVVLVQDSTTGLIFNAAFDPDKLAYDENYQNEQACSSTFKKHLDEVTGIVEKHFSSQTLIEVGCGKGYFLDHLLARGHDIKGIDPAYEGSNPDVIKAPFEPGLGLSAYGIVLRHVLEHIQDPVGFLANIAQANNGAGKIYIEVPCFDWICQQRAWFDIFYEHVNYFRLADFTRMFGTILAHGRIFGGQYIYVVAELSSLRAPAGGESSTLDFPPDFLYGIARHSALAKTQARSAIWGAASKGVIFAVYLRRFGVQIDLAIDINPVKQNRYLPGTGLRVMSPESAAEVLQPGDPLFVMNSNYLAEIKTQSANQYQYLKVDHE
jgi:hypothetical protein